MNPLRRRLAQGAAALAITPAGVRAQGAASGWPSRPLRLIIPFSPGGFTDVVARSLSQRLGASLGQPVVVENKPGAGSTIGADFVAKAAPDGYTLLMVSTTHVIGPALYKKLPYDAIRSFTPIARIVDAPYVLLVHPSLPAKNVAELIALAKAKPGEIDYASSGNGSAQHLVGALFASMAGVQMRHIPYRGSAQATQDLLGGFVKTGFMGTPVATQHASAGRLRALAVTSRQRSPQLPDVPTLNESGVPGYDATIWLGLLAPAGTPPEIVAKLGDEVAKVLNGAEARKAVAEAGVEVGVSTAAEFDKLLRVELERWEKVVKDTGATVD
ncbi:MAG: Bug family tripartite tricarboxylate transporter substrate binding protein [Burkholderiaceae bacterium]|jgi:tripartite-type tricarboxylate transporter receptor subunit TctC